MSQLFAAGRTPWFRRAVSAAVAAIMLLGAGTPLSRAVGPNLPLSERVREADDCFLGRRHLAYVRKAVELIRQQVAEDPNDYEAWWRRADFTCYMARHTSGKEKAKYLAEGVVAGKRAVVLWPNRVEGHFWLGVNLGLEAEQRGYFRGLMMVDSIRKELEWVVKLDPNYEEAGGERTLARLDYRAPFFKGGDKARSIRLLLDALKRFPHNSLARLYLADSYLAMGRRQEAREQLEIILNLCPDPQYGPEQEENQAQARERLAKYFPNG